MNILWICGARVLGGAETTTIDLMRRLQTRSHAITVLCPAGGAVARAAREASLAVHAAAVGGALNPRAWRAIAAALTSFTSDVALVTTVDEWVWACLARRRASTALVLVRHMAVPLSRRVRWLARRRADAIVAVSHVVRRSLSGDGVLPADRVHVIYNPTRFAPRAMPATPEARARARASLGLTAPGRWVGFCGGLNRKKGVLDVIAAVQQVNAIVGPTNLFICGRTDARDRVEAVAGLAERHSLQNRLTYLGDTDRMDAALTAADVVVMATHRALSEALPATLLEAMACGTPVVGYATGGIAEVIGTDGHAGRLAQPDDPDDLGRVLSDVLRDPDAASRMASRALERVRMMFDADRSVTAYEQLFARIRRVETSIQ